MQFSPPGLGLNAKTPGFQFYWVSQMAVAQKIAGLKEWKNHGKKGRKFSLLPVVSFTYRINNALPLNLHILINII